jgi:hypothetical protein
MAYPQTPHHHHSGAYSRSYNSRQPNHQELAMSKYSLYDRKAQIQTCEIRPPIPTNRYDWIAYRRGSEELGLNGYGPTRTAAILNLWYEEEQTLDD